MLAVRDFFDVHEARVPPGDAQDLRRRQIPQRAADAFDGFLCAAGAPSPKPRTAFHRLGRPPVLPAHRPDAAPHPVADLEKEPILRKFAPPRHLHQLRQPAGHGARWRCRPASPDDGLPFGVTFIAPGGSDAALARWRPATGSARARPTLGARLRAGARGRPRAARAAARRAGAAAGRGRRAPGRACRCNCAARRARLPPAWRARAPRPTIACSRCPTPTPPKPGLAARPTAQPAPPSRWRSARCRCDAVGGFLALHPAAAGPGLDRAGRRPLGARASSASRTRWPARSDISVHGGWRAWLESR